MRDDFSKRTIETLAKRVGQCCSNPDCRRPTSGPHTEPSKSVVVGVAAHINAASAGGPRYDADMIPEQRRAIANGIWLCQTCAKLVDSDAARFPAEMLHSWKRQAEEALTRRIESGANRLGCLYGEEHSIRFAVDDWRVWRHRGNRPGDVLIIISPWADGEICYSCKIRLRNDMEQEDLLYRMKIEFRKGGVVVHTDEYAFGDDEVTLPPRRWVSLDVDHGLHDEAIFVGSDSVWFTAESVGDNVKFAWRLAALGDDGGTPLE